MAKKQPSRVKKPYGRYDADLARIRSFLKDKALEKKYDKEMANKLAEKAKRIAEINKKIAKNAKKSKNVTKVIKGIGGKALGVLGLMGAGTLSASATPTDEQKGVNKKQNVDFKAINKDLAKAMYKPLTKKKKGGKKYRDGGFLESKIPNLDDL